MLSKILGNWLNKSSNNDEVAKVSNLPKHEQAKLAVDKMAARKDRPFSPIKAALVELQCINPNILALNERINQYAKVLEEGGSLTPKDCFAEIGATTLDRFFTDADDMYIPLQTLDDFVASSKRLLTVIERGLARNDSNISYSVRLMGKCITSIHNVCKAVESAAA